MLLLRNWKKNLTLVSLQKISDVPNLQSYIPVNDEILVTLHIDNYVYMEQNLNCISNWYTALLMHAYWNSYPIKKVLIT